MKTPILQFKLKILFAFLFIPLASFSQNFDAEVILGINGAQVDGDGFGGYYGGGLVAGFGAYYHVDDKVSFGPEFLYSMKGSKVTQDQALKQGLPLVRYRLNYFEAPLMAKYKVSDYLLVQGGVSVNYLLNAKIDNGTNFGFQDSRNLFKSMDYCGLIGMEWKFLDHYSFNFRWGYSLRSNNVSGPTNPGYGLSGVAGIGGGFFNNYLQFSLRYFLINGEGQSKKTDK